ASVASVLRRRLPGCVYDVLDPRGRDGDAGEERRRCAGGRLHARECQCRSLSRVPGHRAGTGAPRSTHTVVNERGTVMQLEGTARRLTIFIGEEDRYDHKPLATEIVHRAQQAGLAGATVLRGIEGFGASSHV